MTKLTDYERCLVEDYVSTLDFVSRCAQAIEGGNWHYLWDKAHQLERQAQRLRERAEQVWQETQAGRRPRTEAVNAAVAYYGRHYRAARLLHPQPTAAESDAAIAERVREAFAGEVPNLSLDEVIERARRLDPAGGVGGMTDGSMWAVITPDGKLTWYPPAATAEVEKLVGGAYPGALDRAWVAGPLRLLASDVMLLFPDKFELNPTAEAAIALLSGGLKVQPWRGAVALYEIDQDGWSIVMCEDVALRISIAVAEAHRQEPPA